MTNERKLAWGILGTGHIARQFCAGLRGSRTGVAAAVGSRQSESAAAFAHEFGIERFYPNYHQVLTDGRIDAVYVSLPNSMHAEWTIRALEAGKHVLCEKPIAANAGEATEMFQAARKAGRVLVEAFMYRAHPQTHDVIQKVRASAVGQVKLVRTSFCFRTSRIAGNIRFDPRLAGGALMDVGCYCINFSQMVAGAEVTDIAVQKTVHENGVDELAIGTMRFANQIVAAFTCGMTVEADNTAYICGTNGYLEIPRPWKPPATGPKYWLRSTPPQEFTVSAGMDLFALEADDFAATVLDGKAPLISESESIATMRVLDEMRKL